ncbi:MAG TPA: hypothetical protein VF240_15985 [Pyrinomonadaceae bacterium]
MLSVKSRVTGRRVDAAARTRVLERLQETGFTPLIRTMRLGAFEEALAAGGEPPKDMERLMAAWTDAESDAPYVRGDLFCFESHIFFLIFADDAASDDAGLRAGIIHDAEADALERQLESFCRNIDESVDAESARGGEGVGGVESGANGGVAQGDAEWRAQEVSAPESFTRFVASMSEGGAAGLAPPQSARGETAERLRAVEILEDAEARRLLRRLSDAQAEGRTAEMLLGAGREGESLPEGLVRRLAGAALVRRELLISCRKDGRSLFRLPSADALAVMTASHAMCSECGAAVADERAEELVTPTPLAGSMLKDGAWLVSRMRAALAELGVAETDVATRPATNDSDALMMANAAGESFLFVLRDGDFTLAHARRAIDVEADTEVSHLVVVATGKVQEDARSRLREHQKRRARTGAELDLLAVEGVDAAAGELRQALERVTQKSLAGELYELDAGFGMNAGAFVAACFRLTQKPVALQDRAASAAGALAGSLREI